MEPSVKYEDLSTEDKFFWQFKLEAKSLAKTADNLHISYQDAQELKNKIIEKEEVIHNKYVDDKGVEKTDITIEEKKSFSYIIHVRKKWKSKFEITKNKDGGLQSGILGKEKDKKVEWPTEKIVDNFWEFYNWHVANWGKCYYCCISQDDIPVLYKKIYANGRKDKNPTRGRTLEIDRLESEEPYSNIKNLVYSCYWCNNAKTDTFDEEGGKIIGEAIRKIWVTKYDIKIKSCYKK